MCDCDNEECTLPDGRCMLCGTPCEASNGGSEVCAGCFPQVERVYRTEDRVEQCRGRGDWPTWAPFNRADDGSWEIQRNDERGVWDCDGAAAQHVMTLVSSIR